MRHLLKYVLILLVFLSCGQSKAFENIQSTKDVIDTSREKIDKLLNSKTIDLNMVKLLSDRYLEYMLFDKNINLILQAINASTRLYGENSISTYYLYLLLSNGYDIKGDMDAANSIFDYAKNGIRKFHGYDTEIEILILSTKYQYLYQLEDVRGAKECLDKMLSLANRHDLIAPKVFAFFGLAQHQYEEDNLTETFKYLEKINKLLQKNKVEKKVGWYDYARITIFYAHVLKKLKKRIEAVNLISATIQKIMKSDRPYPSNFPELLLAYTPYVIENGYLKNALDSLDYAEKITRKLNINICSNLVLIYYGRGEIFQLQKKYYLGRANYEKALRELKQCKIFDTKENKIKMKMKIEDRLQEVNSLLQEENNQTKKSNRYRHGQNQAPRSRH